MSPQNFVTSSSTRFRVDQALYERLKSSGLPLVLTVSGGTGKRIHPDGTYTIPNAVILDFIERKMNDRNWSIHQNFHSVSIPRELREYFQP